MVQYSRTELYDVKVARLEFGPRSDVSFRGNL
jgi:hypothetical protein